MQRIGLVASFAVHRFHIQAAQHLQARLCNPAEQFFAAAQAQAKPLNASALNRYALQGAGLQLQGRYFQLHYTLTWAKALGDYAGWVPSNIESQPGNSRVNLSVSYLF